MWKSNVDIAVELETVEGVDSLEKAFSLSVLWKNAVYPEGYTADKSWPVLLKLCEKGELFASSVRETYIDGEEADFYLALFSKFNHHDVFFSHEHSDIEGVAALLEREILSGRIRLPYRFGRCLYDRFHDLAQINRPNHLLPHDVDKLLEGTPKGVYQVGNTVIGPFGIITSTEPRAIYPNLKLPLWHCEDTGCNTIHHVDLLPHQTAINRIFRGINRQAIDEFGPPSEWKEELKWRHRDSRWENGRKYSDVIEMIADCIVGQERLALTAHALRGVGKLALRQILSKPPRKKSNSEGSPDEVASRLTPEEQLQLLMYLDDGSLVEYVDELVAKKVIKIPLGDIRRPEFSAAGRGQDQRSELSVLGIRSYQPNAISNLSALIWQAYESEGVLNELAWKLRQAGGKSPRESLFNYIRDKGPEVVVKELVLSSAALTKRICTEVKLALSHVTSSDDISVEKMLWKLGFNPSGYSDTLKRLKSRLSDFNEKLLSIPSIDTENDREAIRSVGVNLFVSLEEFLDSFISYNVWLLHNDHFAANRFHYDIDVARRSVSHALGFKQEGDEVVVSWSPKGNNALGTLLQYLNKTAVWIESLEDENRDFLKKPDSDLPHYNDDKLRPFPFRHTQLWADTDLTELIKHKEGFLSISRLIHQAGLASIRNGIDHHRDEYNFPDADRMIACAARLSQALESADINRYFPKQFWLTSKKENRYGVVEYAYTDYANRELITFGPHFASGLPGQMYNHPVVIAPGNLLGYPNSQLMFWLQERSEYSVFWEDYPKRRKPELIKIDSPSTLGLTEAEAEAEAETDAEA
ncbi:hypothetical protein [Pseudomonas sp. F01002]|uniref:hypothetical protein n=1 Tax=Pseudomonas sp. F01002 TaxID=2555724 RepID=UPI00106D4CDE|nr:hypothetical protein [Pseudomonas sp. F01002]TFB37235.1 hypothetical protein E3W21_21075 [Pseudomonas sp. F01002]